jgi:hypothetical protein
MKLAKSSLGSIKANFSPPQQSAGTSFLADPSPPPRLKEFDLFSTRLFLSPKKKALRLLASFT